MSDKELWYLPFCQEGTPQMIAAAAVSPVVDVPKCRALNEELTSFHIYLFTFSLLFSCEGSAFQDSSVEVFYNGPQKSPSLFLTLGGGVGAFLSPANNFRQRHDSFTVRSINYTTISRRFQTRGVLVVWWARAFFRWAFGTSSLGHPAHTNPPLA